MGAGRVGSTRGRIQGSFVNGVNYPNPFFDVAHTYLPTTVKEMFKYCRYYTLTNPLINATIFKLSEYPITDLIIDHENRDVKRRWEEYFHDHLQYRPFQVECGLDYHCLAGETRVVTRGGVRPIRLLEGQTVEVLSQGGVYRQAEFKSYGYQQLWEVHTDDGVLFATAEHEWVVKGRLLRKQTRELKGHSIPRVVAAKRPEQNDDFWAGVRHGIIFGDGTVSNEGRQAHVLLYTPEKRTLAEYFKDHATITPHHEGKYLGVYGLDPVFKQLPADTLSASYWYGFTCGLLATDGSVNTRGDTVLTQKNPEVLLLIATRLPWLGMVGGRVREHENWSELTEQLEPMNYLTLKKQSLQPQDFIRADQRKRFVDNFEETTYGKFAKVKKVVPSNRFEEVFCCVEPETHTFVIESGILTGNCYGNCCVSIHFPFAKHLTCRNCRFTERADRIREQWTFTNFGFRLTCPSCGHTDDAEVKDVYYKNASGIRLIRWNVEDIEVTYNDVSGEATYFYNIPGPLRSDIVIGKKDVVEKVPQIFIQALRQQKGIVFSKDNFFHMRRPTLAWQDRGWGIPLILPVLKDAFYLQLMKKAQEAILLEHIVPLRVMFPQAASGSADPFTTINLVEWKEQVAAEIARWRYDNNYIPIMPLPLGTQTVGGDGRTLLMFQEMQMHSEGIIMGMGVPLEFLKGGMSYAGTNVSMRMLENAFIGYVLRHRLQANWIMKMVANYLDWPEAHIRFKPFKMADDIQRKQLLFQFNQAQKISDTTLLADSDLNQEDEDEIMVRETSKRLESTRKQQLAMAEVQGEQQLIMMKYQAKAQQGLMQEQGMPAPGEPGGMEGGMTPEEAIQQGEMVPTPAGGPASGNALTMGAPPHPEATLPPDQNLGALPSEAHSQLSMGQRLPQDSAGVDPRQLAQSLAQQIAQLPAEQKQMALDAIYAQSAELGQLVAQFLGGGGGPPSPAVDMRPQPNVYPERRSTPMV